MQQIIKGGLLLVMACILALPAGAYALEDEDSGPAYSVEINKGKLIKLPAAASSVIIADPAIADVQVISPTLVYINGKTIGETSIFAVGSGNRQILHASITVGNNISNMRKMLQQMYPSSNVNVRTVNGALVLEGTVASPIEAENVRLMVAPLLKEKQTLVNMLRSGGSDQVNLRVRVAEVQRNQLKRFSINFENILNHGNMVFGVAQGRDVVSAGSLTRNGNDNSLYGGFRTRNADLNGVIDALENQGIVSILAEPNLTALSGKSASFLAGGEFPIQTVENNTVGIEYKPFGVSLNFTPTVLSKDKISLLVNPEVSELSDSTVTLNGQAVPIIDTRRATTTVELGSGQSFTIAGLLRNNRSNAISKFPGLGDLPVLGALFRSHNFQNEQTELVIIVTPYIVRGVDDPNALTDPTVGLEMPSDFERLLFGRLYSQASNPAEKQSMQDAVDNGSVPHLRGPAGYILH